MSCALVALAPPAAAQTAPAGQRHFIQCRSCHTLAAETSTKAGPHLESIVGRRAGTVRGYAYSPAMRQSSITWTRATLDAFLKRPGAVVPGTKMAFAGMPDAVRRTELIDYLQAQQASTRRGRP